MPLGLMGSHSYTRARAPRHAYLLEKKHKTKDVKSGAKHQTSMPISYAMQWDVVFFFSTQDVLLMFFYHQFFFYWKPKSLYMCSKNKLRIYICLIYRL